MRFTLLEYAAFLPLLLFVASASASDDCPSMAYSSLPSLTSVAAQNPFLAELASNLTVPSIALFQAEVYAAKNPPSYRRTCADGRTLFIYEDATVPEIASLLYHKFACDATDTPRQSRRSFGGALMTSGSFTMMAAGSGMRL